MNQLTKKLQRAGFVATVLAGSVRHIVRNPRPAMTARLMYTYGLRSLPVVAIVAVFSGMIISLQTGIEMARFGQEEQKHDGGR